MLIAPALRITAALAALLLFPALAAAADGERTPLELEASESAQTAASGGAGAGLVRTIVGLAVVLAVIYGLYWVLKQLKASREESVSGSGLRSLATLPLGPNRALHLVRAGDEVVLLGVSEGGVTPVRTYSEAEARDLRLLDADADGDAGAEVLDADAGSLWDPAPAPTRPVPVAALASKPARRTLMAELRRRTER